MAGKGQAPPRTHDLILLRELILPLDPSIGELLDDLALLTPYSIEIRYPDDEFVPSYEDAREARDAAGRVLLWLEAAFPDGFVFPSNSQSDTETGADRDS